jgi:hypothetical protein
MAPAFRESVFGVQTNTGAEIHRSDHTEGRLTTVLRAFVIVLPTVLGTLYRASRRPIAERLLGLIARTSRCQIRMDPSSVIVQPGLCATSHT